jgi:hypothetical protein
MLAQAAVDVRLADLHGVAHGRVWRKDDVQEVGALTSTSKV